MPNHKWIFTVKYKSYGSLERYKVRLVTKGYTQTYDIDYHKTFAPMTKMNTVKILLSLAAIKAWSLNQFDLKNAFLHRDLEDESLFRKKKLFVHFVLDPVIVGDSSAGSSFAARYGCLVIIENVERLDVGALVSIRGIGRVKIMEFVQADPYLKGIVIPMQDNIFECESEISSKVSELKEALYSLNSLEIKLKAPKEELLQTCIAKSLMWAEKEPSVDCDEAFVPSLAERISFAALQPVTGSTQSELLELQREKLRAMDVRETLERIDDSLQLVRKSISMVVAKLAIQSLEVQ
uniref:Reverse transcriptase Ty1/copia-type domain-containing protein n=1 Tax=Vitis vinifera TaxID=29760 RepID=F6I415_VITVI